MKMYLLSALIVALLPYFIDCASVGFANLTEAPQEPPAQSCSLCAPGFGVITLCNGTADTVCAECPPGTFNNIYTVNQPCQPCNSCPDGYYERTPCINSLDVNCAKCYKNGGGFGNEDFLRKCEALMTPPPTTTTSRRPTSVMTSQRTSESFILPALPPLYPKTKKPYPARTTPKPVTWNGKTTEHPSNVLPHYTTTEHKIKQLPPFEEIKKELGDTTEGAGVVAGAVGAADEPRVGAATEIETGGFEWSILIAAVAAAIVFFILGVLVSRCVHKPNTKAQPEFALDYGEAPGVDTVDSAPTVKMISNRPLEGAAVAYEDYDNPGSPIYTGKR